LVAQVGDRIFQALFENIWAMIKKILVIGSMGIVD
jgi:hypothetical protein